MVHKMIRKARFLLMVTLIVCAVTLPAVNITHAQPAEAPICGNWANWGTGQVPAGDYVSTNNVVYHLPAGGNILANGAVAPFGANSRLILPVVSKFASVRVANAGGGSATVSFMDGTNLVAAVAVPVTPPINIPDAPAPKTKIELAHWSIEFVVLRVCWDQ